MRPAASFDPRVAQAVERLRAGAEPDVAAAAALLHQAAADGSAEALRRLAALAAAGVAMRQDWPRALAWLSRAAELGDAAAQGQTRALADEPFEAWFERREKEVQNASPRVVAIRRFLPRAVCDWLRRRTEEGLSEALLLTGERPPADRTYRAHAFGFVDADVVLTLVRAKIAANIGLPLGAFELTQILHYRPQETFGLHLDCLDPAVPAEAAEIVARGQRIVTFLVYLNEGFEGGHTRFPRLGLRFRGEIGDALYWANVDGAVAPDPRTLHEGEAPAGGEKFLLSQGVRSIARV